MLDWVFLFAAVVGGTILVCQFLLTLLGLGHDGGDFHGDAHVGDLSGHHIGDTHAGTDPQHPDSTHLFGVITFRTLVAATAFFGASGKAALARRLRAVDRVHPGHDRRAVRDVRNVLVDAVRSRAWIRPATNASTTPWGETATVYIPIPAARGGAGKVQLSMQNRIVEYQAVTDDAEPLKTGEIVQSWSRSRAATRSRVRRVGGSRPKGAGGVLGGGLSISNRH